MDNRILHLENLVRQLMARVARLERRIVALEQSLRQLFGWPL